MTWTFNKKYAGLTVLLFVVEVFIALYVHDQIIRPYVGDVLVVMLIYCFVRSFLKIGIWPLAIGVLAFSFAVEFSQYLHLVEVLGLEKYQLANVVMGNSYSMGDLVAYTLGIAIVVVAEKALNAEEIKPI